MVQKTVQKTVRTKGVFVQIFSFWNSVRRTPAPPTQHQPPQKSRLSQFSFFTVEVVFVFGLHRLTSDVCEKIVKTVQKPVQKWSKSGKRKWPKTFQKKIKTLCKKWPQKTVQKQSKKRSKNGQKKFQKLSLKREFLK